MMKVVDYQKAWNEEVTERINKREKSNAYYDLKTHKSRDADILQEGVFLRLVDKNSKILDVGCAYGRLMTLFPNSFGIDVSQEMLKRNPFKERIKVMDASKGLDFEDKSFDNIFICRVLIHMIDKDIEKVLLDASRVLKEDGGIWVDISKKFNYIWELKKIYWRLKGDVNPIAARTLTIKKMKQILDNLGFSYNLFPMSDKQVIFRLQKKEKAK